MFDYDDGENKVRCLLTQLRDAIDNDKEEHDRLVMDMEKKDRIKQDIISNLLKELDMERDARIDESKEHEVTISVLCSALVSLGIIMFLYCLNTL